jgi:hypothetical protein
MNATWRYFKRISLLSRYAHLVLFACWLGAVAATRQTGWFFPVLSLIVLYVALDHTLRIYAPSLSARLDRMNRRMYGETTARFIVDRIDDAPWDQFSITHLWESAGTPWIYSREAAHPTWFWGSVNGREQALIVLTTAEHLIILLPPYAIREQTYFTVGGQVTLTHGRPQGAAP